MKDALCLRNKEDKGFNIVTLYGNTSSEAMDMVADAILRSRPGPFIVHVSSGGGSTIPARSIAELLNSYDVPVTWVSRGYNASMAACLPHLGDGLRLCYKGSVFMYHARRYTMNGGDGELLQKFTVAKEEADRTDEIIYKAIGLTKREYKRYNGEDIRLTAVEAMAVGKHGMLDGIIEKDYRDGRFLIQTREGLKEIDVMIHRRKDLATLPVINQGK